MLVLAGGASAQCLAHEDWTLLNEAGSGAAMRTQRKQLTGRMFILAYSSRGMGSIVVGRTWWQGREAANHFISELRKQRENSRGGYVDKLTNFLH